MNRDLSHYRVNYDRDQLLEDQLPKTPFSLFGIWMEDAIKDENLIEPNAMNLATVDEKGRPKSRTVLLKSFDEKGFVFYSNYESAKGKEIQSNAHVALTFLWKEIHRQVRIEGQAMKISREESLRYFLSRPRASQLGAYVSEQSEVLASREILESKFLEMQAQFEGQEIPLPEDWGGYRVRAEKFEFWQGRESRLHDRITFILDEEQGDWGIQRLYP